MGQPYQYQQNQGYSIQTFPKRNQYQHKCQRQNVIQITSSPKKEAKDNMAQFRKGIHQVKKNKKDENTVIKRKQSPKDSVDRKVK